MKRKLNKLNIFVTGSFTFSSGRNAEHHLGTVLLYQNQSFEHETLLALCLNYCVLVNIGFVVIRLCFVLLIECSILFYFGSKFCDYIHESIVQSNYAFYSNATLHNDTLGYLTTCFIVETSKQLVFIRKVGHQHWSFVCCVVLVFGVQGTFSDALK